MEYVCPKCKGSLSMIVDSYVCGFCEIDFPIFLNIPDFRLNIEQSVRKSEYKQAEILSNLCDKFETFEEFMREHIRTHTIPRLLDIELNYELKWKERGEEVRQRIDRLANQSNWSISHKCYLDIGSGKGALLAVMAALFEKVVGVENVFRYCVFAKKLLNEIPYSNYSILCASASNLPFRDNLFNTVTAIDVIEHLENQELVLNESMRVMTDGGLYFLTSPNRYNVFIPEDHVHIYWVGFTPRKYMQRYINMFTKTSYRGVRSLSYFELISYLRTLKCQYVVEGLMTTGNKSSSLKRFLGNNQILLKLINKVFRWIVPLYNVLIKKQINR